MNPTPPASPSEHWKFVASTGRFFCHKEDGKRLVGGDGGEPVRYLELDDEICADSIVDDPIGDEISQVGAPSFKSVPRQMIQTYPNGPACGHPSRSGVSALHILGGGKARADTHLLGVKA